MSSRQTNNQTIRDLITSYNNNQQTYNLNMIDYNRNIASLISLLETNSILNRPFAPRSRPIGSPNFRTSNLNSTLNENINANTTANLRRNIFNDEFYANILLGLTNQIQSPRRGLTRIEIDTYTRNIQYTSDMPNNTCQITHEEFSENENVCQIVHCGHYFKQDAIFRWLRSNSTCPSCRHNLLSSDTIRNTNIDETNEETNDETNNTTNENYEEPDFLNNANNSVNNSVFDFIRNSIPTDASLNIDPSFNLRYSFEFPMVYYPPNNNV